MKNSTTLIDKLREEGERITAVRMVIIEFFLRAPEPLSAADLAVMLKRQNLAVNKTTVYRELAFLQAKNIIKEIEFGDGKTRYELRERAHHHHLICTNCKKVMDIELNRDVDGIIKRIKAKGFQVTEHFLEFFGVCSQCRKEKSL